MLKEFTFICVCYNQERFVIEHLESIKAVVQLFGSNINNDLIVADDGSTDNTVVNVKRWVDANRSLFRSVEVLETQSNMGTVKNMFRAIDRCTTEQFKILAGDDKYNVYDIYDVFGNIGREIIITPVLPFGNFNGRENELINSFTRSYRLLIEYNQKNNIGELLLFRNYIFAPGVFISAEYWRDERVRNLLNNFKYIEDIPMWMLLIYEWKTRVLFQSIPYVSYRISGNETLGTTKGLSLRKVDNDKIKQLYPQRLLDKRKFLHIGFYKYLIKKTVLTNESKYDSFFESNREVKRIYLEKAIG